MSDAKMDVFLLNTPQEGVELSSLVNNLSAAFKKDTATIEKMMSRPRTLIKADVEPALAEKYKAIIEKSGGMCELVTSESVAVLPIEPSTLSTLALEPMAAPPKVETTESASHEDEKSDEGKCYCVKCGTVIRTGQMKCPKCFTPVTEYVGKNKVLAGFLAMFLGGMGIHRLYLGQWWGLFYLLFWGTFIPSIVSFVEALVFWSTSQKSWDEKYGQVPKSGAGVAVIFIFGIFFFIAIIGILAAVSLPAYQDYTNRSKILSAMPMVNEARDKVTLFIVNNHSFPNENILVNLPEKMSSDVIESIQLVDDAKLVVKYKIIGLHENNSIIWVPTESDGKVEWSCMEGTMLAKFRPRECREK